MTHLTPLQISMSSDGALSADEAFVVNEHVAHCGACRARLDRAAAELGGIAAALKASATEDVNHLDIPKFVRPTTLRGFALANLATGLAIWLAQFLWKTIFSELVVNATSWLTSVYLPDVYSVASSTALYLLEEGTAMFDAYLSFVVFTLVVITAAGLLLKYRQHSDAISICLLIAVIGMVAAPTSVYALDTRYDKVAVTVSENETIDDTLIAAAETVLIKGDITGDLIAMGKRVEVTGTVQGNLITFAETITVTGKVGGMALGGGASYSLLGALVEGDLWVGGERVSLDSGARVEGNASVGSQSLSAAGTIGKDLYAFSETVELSGSLGQNLEAFAHRVRLLGDAQIAGDLRFRSGNDDRLHRSDASVVDGSVEYLDMPDELDGRSHYLKVDFYLVQVVRLIAALIVGLLLLWLVPRLRTLSFGGGSDTLKNAGIGILTLVSVPVIAIIVAITVVGIPVSVMGALAWIVAIYLAKIFVAIALGQMLLPERDSNIWPLLAGLAAVIVAINLPLIGGIINFLLTIIGLGLVVQYVYNHLSAGTGHDPSMA